MINTVVVVVGLCVLALILLLGMIAKIDLLLHQTVARAFVMRITDSSFFSRREADREV